MAKNYKVKLNNKDLKRMIANSKNMNLMPLIGEVAVSFSKDAFRKQGWTDIILTPWKIVKDKVGSILIDSGALRNSIMIQRISNNSVTIGSDSEYAEIHNNGGTQRVTDKQRKFFWSRFHATKNGKWKAMAKTMTLKFPARKFIGYSATLNKIISNLINKKLNQL